MEAERSADAKREVRRAGGSLQEDDVTTKRLTLAELRARVLREPPERTVRTRWVGGGEG